MGRSLILVAPATLLLLAGNALALPTGISGYSSLTPNKTCATCHPGGNPPIATLTGPTTLAAGATAEYIFTLETDRSFGGVDIAVDDPDAKLATVSPMTQLLDGEITHSQPLPVENGKIVVKLSLTAPSTAGTVTLHADGQADKKPQIADSTAGGVALAIDVTDAAASGGVGGNGSDPAPPMAVPARGCAFGGGATPDSSPLGALAAALFVGAIAWMRRRAR